ncbi:GGDEF domain-containing protein [Marispirochaeta aestuarii]|uniref:GGDEF domain-containing protein n=1 Tax=Marispirochaeta aestuarii TaxID=1963862 RepID=UPI0029C6569C|nr:GGDEF domain-containing protein [Marispirochaeta aestuarii]
MMRRTSFFLTIEQRLYSILLIFCISLSVISIIGNLVAGFPLYLSIKWLLLVAAASASFVVDRIKSEAAEGMLFFYLFLVAVFLPYAFIESGGSNNNALGYTFLLVVSITYLFKGRTRVFLISLLVLVFPALLTIEYFFPALVRDYPRTAQYIDRMIQVPVQLIAVFLVVLQFSKAYDRTHRELTDLSITDKLTQLKNRACLDERISEELARFRRYGETFSVILTDIDFFKEVNDNFGHQKGDEVLKSFAGLVENNIRETDTIGRWGGEEFMIIIPNCSHRQGMGLAEKLRALVEKHDFFKEQKITCSFGVTEVQPSDSPDDLLLRADQALYLAKQTGRNRVAGIKE